MANFTSVHTGATIDASVTIISGSGVTQSDLTKLNAVTSSAVELNILDGVTSSTAEINILDGLTASTTELNYLDGADSSITTLSLPDNTTITTFGASLVDDADAATARTTLGVDVAGTDNSTDVTLVTTSHDYLSLSGQAITLGQIDISDDTNLVGGDGLALTGDTLSVNVDDSSIEINSDTLRVKALGVTNAMLAGSIANAKLSNSSVSYGGVSVALGSSDATPAFDLSDATSLPIVAGTTGTLSVARGGTGATTASGARTNLNVDVAGTDNSTDVTLVTTSHDYLSLSGQAVTLGQIDISDDTNLVGGTGITLTGDTLSTTDSEIVHDNLSGFVANEHIDHSGVSITAGAGLTGGGDITSTRDIAVGAGTGVTVNADDIAIGQDVATSADVEFNSVTADIIGDIRGATKFTAKADVALNKGDAVYISGVSGNTPTVDIADANDASKMPSFGLAGSSVSINGSVEIFTFGTLPGLNTSSFSVGDILYVSTNGTSGNTLTATKPTGESSLLQNIGTVQRSHASAGSIKVGGAGRTNATPNLDDGDIFIGNGSNQAVSAALNTKIQDYLNTGVNLPSPTFSGDIDFDDASTPVLKITDTTNTVSTIIKSDDSFGNIGTVSNHHLKIKRNDVDVMTFFAGYAAINNNGNDYDFRVLDSGGANLFSTDAANSRVGILDITPSYTLDVNGTGRFTGAVQLDDNLTVTGDLQVNGTTTTVNQTNLDVSDNIIGLNRGASSNANDSGIIIERGSTGDNAAIIFDESADKFTVGTTTSTPSATGNITVTAGTMVANVEGNVTGNVTGDVTGDVTGNADTATALATGRTISLTGDVTGTSASFDGSGNVNLAATIAANSVALGTDTTGNYMSDLTEGTGIDITHTPAEGSNATITLDLTEVGFGGGANRLITDDGDGTVSTESQLTYNGAGQLEIHKDGSNAVLQLRSDDANTRIHFKEGSNLKWNVGYDAGNNKFSFYDGSTVFAIEDGAGANTLILDSNSRVGIGTGSPSNTLEVKSSSSTPFAIKNASNSTRLQVSLTNDDADIFLYDRNTTLQTALRSEGDSYFNQGNLGIGATTVDDGNLQIGDANSAFNIAIAGPRTKFGYDGSNAIVQGGTSKGIAFCVNNTTLGSGEAMRIDSSGNVGIGTASPQSKLNINVSAESSIPSAGNDTNFLMIGNDASGTTNYGTMIGTIGSGAGYIQQQRFDGNATTYSLLLNPNGGKVGIGTTSPDKKLEVSGDIKISGGDYNGLFFENAAGTTNALLYQHTANAALIIKDIVNNTDRVWFGYDGDVGIGQNPTAKLDVVGNIKSSGHLVLPYGEINDAGTDLNIVGTNAVTLQSSAGTALTIPNASNDVEIHDDIWCKTNLGAIRFGANKQGNIYENNDDLVFSVQSAGQDMIFENLNSAGSAYVKNLFIDGSAESVGIGTTSPTAKLDVRGNVSFFSPDASDYVSFTHSDNGIIINSAGSTSNKMTLNTGGSTALTIDASQNVGIGTASPSTKLEVASGNSGGDAALDSPTIRINNTTASSDWDTGDVIGTLEWYASDTSGNAPYVTSFIKSVNETNNGTLPGGALTFGVADYNASGGAAEAMRINEDGNVGIGETNPTFGLQIDGADFSGDAFKITRGTSAFTILNANNDYGVLGMESNHDLQIRTNGTTRMTVDNQGNLKFADNGTNPSSVANTAFLFNDGGELKVLDELGFTTTISPHNFDLIPGGASEDRAWGYYSEKDIVDDEGNVTATQKVNVDMMKLARLVEELTGEKLVYTEED